VVVAAPGVAPLLWGRRGSTEVVVRAASTELAFTGHYLSSVDSERDALTVLKLLYFQERIFVYVDGGELRTDHSFYLAGQRFLTPHYEIERLAVPRRSDVADLPEPGDRSPVRPEGQRARAGPARTPESSCGRSGRRTRVPFEMPSVCCVRPGASFVVKGREIWLARGESPGLWGE
jgi:hypothetical protein